MIVNNFLERDIMKTGILKTGAGVAVEVRCPDCGEALCANQCEDRIFWTDEVSEGDTGYCPKCQATHLLPDLSTLKVVDAGLFQEMLDMLGFWRDACGIPDKAENLLTNAGANKLQDLISKAEKA